MSRENSRKTVDPLRAVQVGNPAGRRSAGAVVRDWLNAFADSGLTAADLRAIVQDERQPAVKRSAAERALRMAERPDMAAFEPYLDGTKTLEDLRKDGVDTAVVKKARTTVTGTGDAARVTREVELHDRSGEEFDRVADRTDGRPKQSVEVKQEPIMRTPADRARTAEELAERLRRLLNPSNQ